MASHSERGSHVATIFYQHPDFTDYPRLIESNDDFHVGRKDVKHAFGLEEQTVSSHHLHFHCVVFEDLDDEESQRIAPLVYVRVLSSNAVVLNRLDSNNPSDGCTLRRDSGDVLLNDGDVLQLTESVSVLFQTELDPAQTVSGLDVIRRAEIKRFSEQYLVIDRMLGSGGNASVFVAVKQSTKRQFACKIVPVPPHKRQNLLHTDKRAAAEARAVELRQQKKRDDLGREHDVLKNLSHPNIISLEKVFCTTSSIYIIQELITGGDLLSYVERIESLSEPEAAVIIRQVLKAVEYLHSNQIVHRDIKPENVLMTSWRPGARVVLTDFGQSRTLEDAKGAVKGSALFRMQSLVGTHGYTAPEVFKQMKQDWQRDEGYSKAIDIWSVGCVAGTLLTGEPMRLDEDGQDAAGSQAQASVKRWDLRFMDIIPSWRAVGRKAKSFIRGCLEVDESKRLTAKQALLHEWFTNKHYAADLEAAYQRAIHDWKPRATTDNLVEFIDTADVLATETKQQHIERLVQETRSRHFPSDDAQLPYMSAMGMKPFQLPPPTKKHTPLSAIADGTDLDYLDSLSRCDPRSQLFASPVCVPNTPPRVTKLASDTHGPAAEACAPLETQLTCNDTMLPSYTQHWHRGVTQSQSMLDELSPPKYELSEPADHGTALPWPSKRNATLAQMDESYTGVTQYTGDLDAPYPAPQRRKVYI